MGRRERFAARLTVSSGEGVGQIESGKRLTPNTVLERLRVTLGARAMAKKPGGAVAPPPHQLGQAGLHAPRRIDCPTC
jgi:hypothetical protein